MIGDREHGGTGVRSHSGHEIGIRAVCQSRSVHVRPSIGLTDPLSRGGARRVAFGNYRMRRKETRPVRQADVSQMTLGFQAGAGDGREMVLSRRPVPPLVTGEWGGGRERAELGIQVESASSAGGGFLGLDLWNQPPILGKSFGRDGWTPESGPLSPWRSSAGGTTEAAAGKM